MRRFVLICNWLLLVTIATLSDRAGDLHENSLGATGLLKVTSRAAALSLLMFVIARTWSDPRRGAVIRQMLPWCAFGAWAVVSTIWSPLPTFSLGQSVSLVLLIMLSYCTAMVARRITDVSQVFWHLCWGLLLLSTTLTVANFVAPDTFGFARETVTGGFHPTNAAATAGLGLVLIVSARLIFAWRWTYWLIWPSLLVHCGALLLAHNRASIIVTPLVVGGIVLLQSSVGWRWLLLTTGSIACAIYVALDPGFLLVSQGGDQIAQYMARDQSAQQLAAFSGREEMWTNIWESFLRSPWIGHGYFVSSESGSLYVWYVWANWTAHNFWLQALVGTGLIGGALLAWALISYAIRLVCARGKGVGLHRLISMGLAVLIWQTCWGLTNESFVGPLQAESIVFFVVLGLVTGRLVHGASAEQLWRQQSQLVSRYNQSLSVTAFRLSR
jgi:O-antigen ligase